MAWPNGQRRPPSAQWARTKAIVKARAQGRCAIAGCLTPGTEVDHIIPWAEGGTDTPENGQLLCPAHHEAKTQAEAQRGQQRRRDRGRRAPEAHPFDMI